MTIMKNKKALKIGLYSSMAGTVGIEPTLMVLETIVKPFNYVPIFALSKIILSFYNS